jgi:putative pyruvate formate lyase activating enzyme
LRLQALGCHNINLVTPTHYAPNILQALRTAVPAGLRVPLVYNCGGYEPVEVLEQLDGIVDIYLADFKYADGLRAGKYSNGAEDYPAIAAAALLEMRRQVGDLETDEDGIALRGLIIRHLILPNNLAGTDQFVRFVAEKLGKSTFVNLMTQDHPEHEACRLPDLNRRVTRAECLQAQQWARDAGLENARLQ